MKKKPILIALCSILILAVAVVAIIKFTGFANKPDSSTDTMELSEVSGYVLEKGYTQEQIEEKLKGEFRNDIIASWGLRANSIARRYNLQTPDNVCRWYAGRDRQQAPISSNSPYRNSYPS